MHPTCRAVGHSLGAAGLTRTVCMGAQRRPALSQGSIRCAHTEGASAREETRPWEQNRPVHTATRGPTKPRVQGSDSSSRVLFARDPGNDKTGSRSESASSCRLQGGSWGTC